MSARPAVALRWAPAWVVAVVALWPLPMATNVLLGAGALAAAGWLLLRRSSGGGGLLSGPAWALTSVLFCAYWLPEIAAALDAESGWPAWRSALLDLRLLPALWLAAAAVADAGGRRRVFTGLALVALVWALDALVAVATGSSLLHGVYAWLAPHSGGFVVCPQGTTWGPAPISAFAGCGAWQGLALASLSPFALALGARFGMLAWLLVALVMAAAIAATSTPMAWIAFACVLLLELRRRPGWRHGLSVLAVACAGVGLSWALASTGPSRPLAEGGGLKATRVQAAFDATSVQWRGALCVALAHPLNGAGVGGLEPALRDCLPAAATGAAADARALPLLLDVFAETGAAGLLLWLAGVALAWRAWRFADAAARHGAWPALQALMAMLFPLNASLPTYAAPWGAALLLMAGLYAGALWGREREQGAMARNGDPID